MIKISNKRIAISIATILMVAAVLVAMCTPALSLANQSQPELERRAQARRAVNAIRRARRAIGHAISNIIEQAEQGANVTLAKRTLRASIRIYLTAERALIGRHPKKAFLTATLSRLVACDSTRLAVEDPEALNTIIDEVGEKIDDVEEFLSEAEASGANVTLARRALERAENLYEKAGELRSENPVRALVIAEASRMLAHIAKLLVKVE